MSMLKKIDAHTNIVTWFEIPVTDTHTCNAFFDQAHFIKEFKKYTGITPHQYQAQARLLALNFLEL